MLPRLYSANSRSLIHFYLSSIDLSTYQIVYLPEFICNELVPVFSHFKLEIRFYPLSNKFEPLLEDINPYSIVLLVSYFGFPCQTSDTFIIFEKSIASY